MNTGWIGGPYGVGKRISIGYTRALLTAALSGELLQGDFTPDPIFGFDVPAACAGVPTSVLNPAGAWADSEEHARKYRQLALRFVENFKKYADQAGESVRMAGPKV